MIVIVTKKKMTIILWKKFQKIREIIVEIMKEREVEREEDPMIVDNTQFEIIKN